MGSEDRTKQLHKKEVTQGLIRQSLYTGKTWTGITHNAYTETRLRLRSDKC